MKTDNRNILAFCFTIFCFTIFCFSIPSHGLDSDVAATSAIPSSFDALYIKKMTQQHQDGIEMAKIAVDNGESLEVKSMGQKIIADQTKEMAQLREWKTKWYKEVVVKADMPEPDMSHLRSLKGKEFDQMFLKMMTEHHQGAIRISKDMMSKLKQKEIRNFAKSAIKKQKSEIAQLEKMESKFE